MSTRYVSDDFEDGFIGDSSDAIPPYIQQQQTKSWYGRVWETVSNAVTVHGVKKVAAVTSSAATVATAAFSAYRFWQNGYEEAVQMACSGIMGVTATTAIGTAIPYETSAKILDFMARYSFEAYEATTELFINALCPVMWCQAWDLAKPPQAVEYAAMLTFSSLATSTIALSLRPLFFKERRITVRESRNELLPEGNVQTSLLPRRRVNKLCLETSTKGRGWFLAEQAVKACVGASLLLMSFFGPSPGEKGRAMMLSAGCFSLGLIPGAIGGRIHVHFENKINNSIEDRAKNSMDLGVELTPGETACIRVGKVCSIAATMGLGGLFIWQSPYAFLGIGAALGYIKMLELRRFEQLHENPDSVQPFEWAKISSYAKGEFLTLAITCAWYGWGLTDPSNSLEDWIDIGVMIGSASAAYVAVRQLLQRFNPATSHPASNSALFYSAYFPVLIVPYLFRRAAGDLHDSYGHESIASAIINGVSWGSFGAAWGALRQVYSARSENSPSIITLPVQVIAGLILSSRGRFRV